MKMRSAGLVLKNGDLGQVYACKCNLVLIVAESNPRTACPKCARRMEHVAQIAASKESLMAVAKNKAVLIPKESRSLKLVGRQ